jgi:surfeit locus 1 family protein
VREDISGPGTWAFLPARCRAARRRGQCRLRAEHDAGPRQQDRAVARLVTNEPVTLTGYIRFPKAPAR